MSNRDDNGGRPPPDDRTLLDPLSNDELEALRQARQRLQAQRKGQSGPESRPRQMVVGPEDDESIGSAPTRSMPALPTFDGKVSLDQIGGPPHQRVSGEVRDPAARPGGQAPRGAAPSEPMSVYSGTVGPSGGDVGDEPTITPSTPNPAGSPAGSSGPKAGSTGFGENTLMWMQPPKMAPTPQVGTADVLSPGGTKTSAVQKLKSFAALGGALLVVAAIAAATIWGGQSGVVELHTDPPGAVVEIDGKLQAERTPVKLTMNEGSHDIRLSLDGYAPKTLEVIVDPERPGRKDVTLEPTSAAGLLTVGISVQPVSAKIVVDDQTSEGKRSIKIPNLDPAQPHTIVIEAPGYKGVEKKIAAGELKKSYTFVLQADPDARPE